MRAYDFRCSQCDRVFEELVEDTDSEVRCPACASTRVERQLSVFSIGRSSGGSCGGSSGSFSGGGCQGGMCGL